MIRLEDFFILVNMAADENPEWRYGQAVFNVLYRVRPDLSEQVRGTSLDPFYKRDAGSLAPLWEWLEEAW